MSEQNQKTLDIYDRIAQAYLDSIIKHYQINPHEAAIKLNLLTDPLPSNLSGILAWRVFVHFTKDDLKTAFTKIYQALLPDGKFIFNAINRAAHHPNSAWLDFPGEYHLNEKRFFAYYTQSEIAKLDGSLKYIVFAAYPSGAYFSRICIRASSITSSTPS